MGITYGMNGFRFPIQYVKRLQIKIGQFSSNKITIRQWNHWINISSFKVPYVKSAILQAVINFLVLRKYAKNWRQNLKTCKFFNKLYLKKYTFLYNL